MEIAEAIVVLRERMGIKQIDLADRLGVTVTSISRYENGRQPDPTDAKEACQRSLVRETQ